MKHIVYINLKKSLKKADKLTLKSDFAYVRENGRKYVGRLFLLVVTAGAPDDKLRCGVICGRKFSKKAVVRNRARRLLWESFRYLKSNIKPVHMVLITRSWIKDKKQQDVQKEMELLLKKARVYEDEAR